LSSRPERKTFSATGTANGAPSEKQTLMALMSQAAAAALQRHLRLLSDATPMFHS
jgi:hypothetical protein